MVRLHLNLSSNPEFNAWLTEFQGESDRAAAVLGPAYLDWLLIQMLEAAWVDTKESQALANSGSFTVRVRLVHAMGLIADDEAADLKSVGRIRNIFAHQIDASFEGTAKVASPTRSFVVSRERMMAEGSLRKVYSNAPLRKRFDFEIALLAYYLTRRLAHVKRLSGPKPALTPGYDLGHEHR